MSSWQSELHGTSVCVRERDGCCTFSTEFIQLCKLTLWPVVGVGWVR